MGRIVSKTLIVLICFHLVHTPVVRASASIQVLTFASALAAPMVLTQCKSKISAWIFLGSAGLLLATELLNSKKHKDDSKAIKVDLKSKDPNEKQIAALEAAAAAADTASQSADKRAKSFKMAAIGFGAAAAAALVEAYLSKPGTSPNPPGCIRPDEMGCSIGACQPGGSTLPIEEELPTVMRGGEPWQNWFWWLPTAHAMDMKSAIAPAMGVGAWYLIKKKFTAAHAFIGKTLNNGYKRGAVFGAFSGMAFLASSSLEKDAKNLSKRAKTYRNLAAKMRRRLGLKAGMNEGTLQYIPPAYKGTVSGQSGGSTDLVKVDGACVIGKTGQFPQVDEKCLCKKNNNCKKATLPKVDYGELPGVSTALNEASSLLKNYSDKTYSGNLSGAGQVSDASLSQSAVKVNRLKKKLWDMSKKHAQKSGQKFVDGSRLENAYTSRLKKAINSDLRKLSSEDKAKLASLSPNVMNNPDSGPADKVSKSVENAPVAGATTGGKGLERRGRPEVGLDGFDLIEENDQETPSDEQEEGDSVVPADFSDKSVQSNRIQSIWKVVSGRYYKLYFGITE